MRRRVMARAGKRLLGGQRGFSLLEVMTALVVLTVGLMGIAAMQDIAISQSVNASAISVGTNLAEEMIERIQYSQTSAVSYNGIDVGLATNCPVGASVMVAGDCAQWRTRLIASNLINVRGTVQVTTIGPTVMNQWQVVVQVTWRGLLRPVTLTTTVSLG
jgi:type IV pilus assembly protein PilV